eukprot:m.226269 g.226269  ORF g.226269 m.226269 type:complete len:831 (-) comp15168_c0_seq1:132-2624(-)
MLSQSSPVLSISWRGEIACRVIAFLVMLSLLSMTHATQRQPLLNPPQVSRMNGHQANFKQYHAAQTLYTINLTACVSPTDPQTYYETVQLIAAIQGLVNREEPTFFSFLTDADTAWWPFTQKQWLADRPIIALQTIDDVFNTFKEQVKGAVIYDTSVPSTSNVAGTLSGAFDLLPFAYRPARDNSTLYAKYIESGLVSVAYNLTGMFTGNVSGSAKCDAYLWAVEHLIVPGHVNAAVHGYIIDYFWASVSGKAPIQGNTIPNQDYVIAQRGFLWDLDVWTDEPPNDDPSQPLGTDYNTLLAILEASNQALNQSALIHVVGFVPWAFKYVNDKHPGVATEWQMVVVLSSFNAYVDADACCIEQMSNAAFLSLLPLKQRYIQNAPLTRKQLQQAGYLTPNNTVPSDAMFVAMYVGDYDSAAWLYTQIKQRWDDATRGTVPLGWAIDAELSWRFPVAFEYMLSSLTPNDRIISGDSGAGYLNPTQLLAPRLPSNYTSADALWQQHNTPLYAQFDQRFTGFLLQGDAGALTPQAAEMYAAFSMTGVCAEQGSLGVSNTHLQGNMPVFMQQDLPNTNVQDAVTAITNKYNTSTATPQFFMWRAVLQYPSYYQNLAAQLAATPFGSKIHVVDPLVMSYLARAVLGGTNNNQVAYVSDNCDSTTKLAHPRKKVHAQAHRSTRAALHTGVRSEKNASVSWSFTDAVRVIPRNNVWTLNVTVRNDGWNDLSTTNVALCANVTALPTTTPAARSFSTHAALSSVCTCSLLTKKIHEGETGTTSLSLTTPDTVAMRLSYSLATVNNALFTLAPALPCQEVVDTWFVDFGNLPVTLQHVPLQ